MLSFGKLTGEYNNKKTLFKFFVLWEYIFKSPTIKSKKNTLANECNTDSTEVK